MTDPSTSPDPAAEVPNEALSEAPLNPLPLAGPGPDRAERATPGAAAEIEGLEARRDLLAKDLLGHGRWTVDAIARRLRAFQDYLVVALQDLARPGQSRLIWRCRRCSLAPLPLDQNGPARRQRPKPLRR